MATWRNRYRLPIRSWPEAEWRQDEQGLHSSVNQKMERSLWSVSDSEQLVSQLVGILSQVNHKGLHRGTGTTTSAAEAARNDKSPSSSAAVSTDDLIPRGGEDGREAAFLASSTGRRGDGQPRPGVLISAAGGWPPVEVANPLALP